MDFVVFIFALAIILLGAELFTNGIEWFGHRLNLGEGAVGSVLAAVATALPETLIPVIAIIGPILSGTEASAGSEEVGVGAILGAPFTLATLAMFITGVAVLYYTRSGRHGPDMDVNVKVMAQDVVFFLVAYSLAIGAAFLPVEWRWADVLVVIVLVVVYAIYVRAHFRDSSADQNADLARLHATRVPGMRRLPRDPPAWGRQRPRGRWPAPDVDHRGPDPGRPGLHRPGRAGVRDRPAARLV